MTNARAAKSAREKSSEMRQAAARKEARMRSLMVSVVVALVILVVGMVAYALKVNSDNKAAQDAPPANVTNNAFVVGDTNAPDTLIINEDFLCPACKSFEEAATPAIKQAVDSGKIQVHYQPISILNRLSMGTEYPSRAAAASASVWNQGDADVWLKFHDLLYARQPAENSTGLDNATIADIAEEAGADRASVEGDLDAKKYMGWIEIVTDQSSQEGMTGTPYLRWNGEAIDANALLAKLSELNGPAEATDEDAAPAEETASDEG